MHAQQTGVRHPAVFRCCNSIACSDFLQARSQERLTIAAAIGYDESAGYRDTEQAYTRPLPLPPPNRRRNHVNSPPDFFHPLMIPV